MSTILIQTRVDEYTTPELYAELEAIPAGNARTTRLKNLANEALILKRQLGLSGNAHGHAQGVDAQRLSGVDSFTARSEGKTARRTKVKAGEGEQLPATSEEQRDVAPRAAAGQAQPAPAVVASNAPAAEASTPQTEPVSRGVSSGSRAASRVLSMNTLRGG